MFSENGLLSRQVSSLLHPLRVKKCILTHALMDISLAGIVTAVCVSQPVLSRVKSLAHNLSLFVSFT